MKTIFGCSLILVLCLIVSPVYADDFQDGLDSAKRGDYGTAYEKWEPLAGQGDTDAQFNLGLMYYYGKGIAQDYKKAAKWYRLSAEQGDANAQFRIARMSTAGQGAPQDYKKSG